LGEKIPRRSRVLFVRRCLCFLAATKSETGKTETEKSKAGGFGHSTNPDIGRIKTKQMGRTGIETESGAESPGNNDSLCRIKVRSTPSHMGKCCLNIRQIYIVRPVSYGWVVVTG